MKWKKYYNNKITSEKKCVEILDEQTFWNFYKFKEIKFLHFTYKQKNLKNFKAYLVFKNNPYYDKISQDRKLSEKSIH